MVARAGLVGCGSIGRRHLANLVAREDVSCVLVKTGNRRCLEGLPDSARTRFVDDMVAERPDFAVIASETARHAADAEPLISAGIPVLIEKPLAVSAAEASGLVEIARSSGTTVGVAYNMRFLPVVARVRELLAAGEIGTPVFARFEVGQHLSTWRPDIDHRASYSACAERGGGAALDLSHEVDLMRLVFGEPCVWTTLRANTGVLGIDAEEVFDGLYKWTDGLTCSVHADYVEPGKRRAWRIVGSNGVLECDLVAGRLRVQAGDEVWVEDDESLFDFAKTLAAELDDFVRALASGSTPACTAEDGLAVLGLLEDSDA